MLLRHNKILAISLMLFGLTSISFGQITFETDFSEFSNGIQPTGWEANKGDWRIQDGVLCESSGEYDVGLTLPLQLSQSYELEFTFQSKGSNRGAGILFNMMLPGNNTYGHLLRLDNATLIYGYLDRAEYQAIAEFPTQLSLVNEEKWHHFKINVNPKRGIFSAWIDQEIVIENKDLRFKSGYVALQNSGGNACFDDVKLSMEESSNSSQLAWSVAGIPLSQTEAWIGSANGRIQKVNKEDKILKTINPVYELMQLSGMVSLESEGFLALDKKNGVFHHYQQDGKYKKRWEIELGEVGLFTSWGMNKFIIWDKGNEWLLVYDDALKLLHEAHQKITDLKSLLEVMNQFRGYGEQIVHVAQPPYTFDAIAFDDFGAFVVFGNEVFKIDWQGNQLATLDLSFMGDLLIQNIAFFENEIWLTDLLNNRIIRVDKSFKYPNITIEKNEEEVRATWESASPDYTSWKISPEGNSEESMVFLEEKKTHHEVSLIYPERGKLYQLNISPTLETIPKNIELSANIPLMTAPPKGKMQYKNLNAIAILFVNVNENGEVAQVSEEEIQKLIAQLEDGRRFYWVNSGMHLNIEMTYLIDKRSAKRSELFTDEWYYPPQPGKLEETLAFYGYNIEDYQAVFYLPIMPVKTENGVWKWNGKGGAFTNGLGWNGKYGRSWWEVPDFSHVAGNNWLFVHEFHHQLDELFLLSGYRNYWFNHFSPHAGYSANFGEHFDGNAYILRNWEADKWFELDFGTIAFATDLDEDGIPDDAPNLPLDEKRLGSNPTKKDSDGDGVSDLAELSFSNWIISGVGEDANPSFVLPNLMQTDTDKDGMNDKEDLFPLYPFKPEIAQQFETIAIVPDMYEIQASYDATAIKLRFRLEAGNKIRVLLDGNADGWFVGDDNYELQYDLESQEATSSLFNAGYMDRWAFSDKEATIPVSWTQERENTILLSIPKQEHMDGQLEAGKQIQLTMSVGKAFMKDNAKFSRYISFGEPNRFITFTLK